MRGYPPIQLFFFILVFGAVAVPLARLTFAREKTDAPVVAVNKKQSENLIPTHLRVRFAHPMKSLSLKLNGRELPRNSPTRISTPASPVEIREDIDIPADGIEFIVSAQWPDGTPDTALTLEVEPDGLDTKSETRWSSGNQLTEVISFQWK